MSVKYFCDRCDAELEPCEGGRLSVHIKEWGVEVMHKHKDTWNYGSLCWKCVREIVAKGEPS